MSVKQAISAEAKMGRAESLDRPARPRVWDYIKVMKPRETGLLTFVGMCAAIVAGLGHPPGPYFTGTFGPLYLLAANVLGLVMIAANAYFLKTGASGDAWKVFKLSAYPYLGLIFTLMCLDLWLRY